MAAPPAAALPQPALEAEPWIVTDLRRIAAVTTAGLVLGFVVNGWGSRFAMMLLARLNPDATGVLSDDGFTIGTFGLADTMGLVLFGTVVGVLGGLLFLAVRPLRFGPPWFQTASMTVGPAVVIGALLVHTDGVDFRLLQPAWLAIALFVALPGLFAYGMVRLGDRWLREGSWFRTGPRWRTAAALPVLALLPLVVPVAAALVARAVYRTVPAVRDLVRPVWLRAAGRVGLSAVFLVAAVDLARDVVELV